jgi:archaellum component FlaC
MDKLKELKLYTNSKGQVVDTFGMQYFLPKKGEGVDDIHPFQIDGGLDMSKDVTITGNLTVQQSEWVYLRGPITSSRILINGSMTGSNLWIRDRSGGVEHPMEGMGYGIFDNDIIVGGESVKESIERINVVENQFGGIKDGVDKANRTLRDVEWLMKKVEDFDRDKGGKDRELETTAIRNRINRLEEEMGELSRMVREIKGDLDIIMGILHK